MKTFFITLLAVFTVLITNAEELAIRWSGQADKVNPPKIEHFADNDWKSIRCTPTEEAQWQSLLGTFVKPLDLSKYKGITFDFKQKCYPGNPTCVFYISMGATSIYAHFQGGNGKDWQHVEIPFETTKWKNADKIGFSGTAVFFRIYPYQFLDKTTKYIEIANLEFIPAK